jgi:hypothetical protein
MRHTGIWTLLWTLSLCPTLALAEPAPDEPLIERAAPETVVPPAPVTAPWPDVWGTRHFGINGQIGLGTPYSYAGLSLEVSPFRYLALDGGIGYGGGVARALQWAAMARLRLPLARFLALCLGAGVSGGRYQEFRDIDLDFDGNPSPDGRVLDHAFWLNGEASVQFRLRRGFQVRPYLGVTRLLNPDQLHCDVRRCLSGSKDKTFPYFGAAVGYSF